jgi:hypothetical protein
MSGKALFLDQFTFIFDVMDVNQDQQLDLDELHSVLASLAGCRPDAILDFQGQPVTPLMYLRMFVQAFVDATGFTFTGLDADAIHAMSTPIVAPSTCAKSTPIVASLSKPEFATLLQTHPASELLTRPFRLDLLALFARERV